MRGASALEDVLQGLPGAPVAVFVVWEPILVTDIRGPKTKVLARVWDRRAAQFWDRGHLISQSMGGAANFAPKLGSEIHFDMKKHVWDFVGVYPAGFRWSECGASPSFAGAPVVDVTGRLKAALASALAKPLATPLPTE